MVEQDLSEMSDELLDAMWDRVNNLGPEYRAKAKELRERHKAAVEAQRAEEADLRRQTQAWHKLHEAVATELRRRNRAPEGSLTDM